MCDLKQQEMAQQAASLQLHYPDAECEPRVTINLNELLAALIKQVCPPAMLVRMEEMPQIKGSTVQLQVAFRLLLGSIAAAPPATGRHYLHLKCMEAPLPETGQPQQCSRIAVHSNITSCNEWRQREAVSISAAKSLLNANRMGLECRAGEDGCLYLLTLPGNSPT